MTDTKFTPGPWAVRMSDNGYPHQIEAPSADDGKAGAVGKRITRWGFLMLPSSAEAEANAHLIAAAPDLYATLAYYADQFCEGFCGDLPNAGTYNPEMDIDCSGCKSRAALAKARGES